MLRDLADKREEKILIDDSSSVSKLIEKICENHGKRFRDYVFDIKGKPREGFAFAVDGISISQKMLPKMKCKGVSEFVILPPISGGST